MTGDDARVRLPPELQTQCEKRIEGTNFESVEEYVQFVVAEACAGTQDDSGSRRPTTSSDKVSERLESLGYL